MMRLAALLASVLPLVLGVPGCSSACRRLDDVSGSSVHESRVEKTLPKEELEQLRKSVVNAEGLIIAPEIEPAWDTISSAFVAAEKLSTLVITGTNLTDAQLKAVALLPNLEILCINATPITNAGLKHLEGIESLRRVALTGTNVTSEGVRALGSALPQTEIFADREPATEITTSSSGISVWTARSAALMDSRRAEAIILRIPMPKETQLAHPALRNRRD